MLSCDGAVSPAACTATTYCRAESSQHASSHLGVVLCIPGCSLSQRLRPLHATCISRHERTPQQRIRMIRVVSVSWLLLWPRNSSSQKVLPQHHEDISAPTAKLSLHAAVLQTGEVPPFCLELMQPAIPTCVTVHTLCVGTCFL